MNMLTRPMRRSTAFCKRLVAPAITLAIFAIVLFGGFSACSTTPRTPAEAVVAAHGAYQAAATAIIAYKARPSCGPPDLITCADPAIVKRLQTADQAAYDALKAGEAAARTGASVDTVQRTLRAVADLKTLADGVK